MAEHDVSVGRHVIEAVVMPLGRRNAGVVQFQDFVGNEPAVEAIGDEVNADRRCNEPRSAHRLIVIERDSGKGKCAKRSYAHPDQQRDSTVWQRGI
jgi:hypothetical protein